MNTIYDFPDLRLLAKKGYARIREVVDRDSGEAKTFMTVKTMISQEKYKIMEENETRIEDAKAGHGLFVSLGLKVRKTLIKDRISYRFEDALIEIDDVAQKEYPFPLLEIETTNPQTLHRILEFLDFQEEDTTSLTMTEILARHSQEVARHDRL